MRLSRTINRKSGIRFLLWLFKLLLTVACIVILLGIAIFEPLFLQDRPRLEASSPPTPQDVATTRQLVRDLRKASGSNIPLQTDATQLNSTMRLGARFIRGFRGRVTVGTSDVLGEMSVPVPWWHGEKWLNISGRVPAFDKAVSLSQVTVGNTSVPPDFAISVARLGANLSMGNHFGNKVLTAASAMQISGNTLIFRITLYDVGKNGVMRSVFGSLRGAQMPTSDEIETYHLLIRAAMEEGRLKQTGSFLPYLQFALAVALERSSPQTLSNTYTAAIFGLAKVCGARDFAMIVGRLAFDAEATPKDWSTTCSEVTFNNRVDSRRHFVTAAALQAASNTGVAVSIGEFKELYDSISRAGGFDFTDMAANLSGIEMSDVLMAAPYEAWPMMLDQLSSESDVIVPFDGIPRIMTETEFKTRFLDVDSPKYKAMLAMIETKINQLGLYQPQ